MYIKWTHSVLHLPLPNFFRLHHPANVCELWSEAASVSSSDDLSFLSGSSHKSGHIQSRTFRLAHVFCLCVLWVSGVSSESFFSFKPGQRRSLLFHRLLLGCCLIPFLLNFFKDAYHTCPRCQRVLHIHRKTCCEWQTFEQCASEFILFLCRDEVQSKTLFGITIIFVFFVLTVGVVIFNLLIMFYHKIWNKCFLELFVKFCIFENGRKGVWEALISLPLKKKMSKWTFKVKSWAHTGACELAQWVVNVSHVDSQRIRGVRLF